MPTMRNATIAATRMNTNAGRRNARANPPIQPYPPGASHAISPGSVGSSPPMGIIGRVPPR